MQGTITAHEASSQLGRAKPTLTGRGPRRAAQRILHLTTEYPPVIYGGLGTAVGGWVNASARAGIQVAVQLVEGPLAVSGAVYGCAGLRRPAMDRATAVAQHDGVTFFQCSWAQAVELGIRLVRDWRA